MVKMVITYEVTAIVHRDLAEDFERYMNDRHIPDVMATGAFESSVFTRYESGRYRIIYRTSRESLDEYLRVHAPGLRGHVADTFPEGVELTREEWEVLATF